MNGLLGLLLATVVGFGGPAGYLNLPVQPYGGCDEAHRYPHSQGAADCRAQGWLIRPRIVVDPDDQVVFNVLPACQQEDGSTTVRGDYQRHCFWNAGTSGNGAGDSYILDHVNGGARATYVTP